MLTAGHHNTDGRVHADGAHATFLILIAAQAGAVILQGTGGRYTALREGWVSVIFRKVTTRTTLEANSSHHLSGWAFASTTLLLQYCSAPPTCLQTNRPRHLCTPSVASHVPLAQPCIVPQPQLQLPLGSKHYKQCCSTSAIT
eukprot:1158549-Pelagomonas_calceolata.AAC.5